MSTSGIEESMTMSDEDIVAQHLAKNTLPSVTSESLSNSKVVNESGAYWIGKNGRFVKAE